MKPGQWVVISGIGGLGHVAVQYAVAMGMRIVAVDIADDKLELAKRHGAEVVVNAKDADPVPAVVEATKGGGHGILVTAVHPQDFDQAIGMSRKLGTIVVVGLPPAKTEVPIFDVVLNRIAIRGSIVGTRHDMVEALDFFARGLITPTIATRKLDEINDIFGEMHRGEIDGRIVIDDAK
ncbi:Alcohol dehydrogenase [Pseudoclavibacter triregionum]|nr:Alcohol dehydrogenase [Pseudoclavibacter triregionum]